MNNIISREKLLDIVAEEKETYIKYLQSCAKYQVNPDPLATSKHHGMMEILNRLLQETTKI